MKNAIQFAAEHTNISKNSFEVIIHSRKSLLFHFNQPWVKRDNDTFDVTVGAYNGAEICELVGIVNWSLLSKKFCSNNIGLYRDDGLSVFRNSSVQQAEKHKKNSSKSFERQRLTNNYNMQSENNWLIRGNIKFEWWYIPPFL